MLLLEDRLACRAFVLEERMAGALSLPIFYGILSHDVYNLILPKQETRNKTHFDPSHTQSRGMFQRDARKITSPAAVGYLMILHVT